MAIWVHPDAETLDRELDLFSPRDCPYCSAALETQACEDLWPWPGDYYLRLHRRHIKQKGRFSFFKLFGNEPDVWRATDAPSEIRVDISSCPVCGWWDVSKTVELGTRWQIWQIIFRTEGVLKALDFTDIRLPIEEVRQYLAARYEARSALHPRVFEGVVASVFRSLGYESRLTAYTRDGGLDVVLQGPGKEIIGVQVKRTERRISVEQIRSFAGAMLLGGASRGIFVTTSAFSLDSMVSTRRYLEKGLAIELMDATAFREALGIAQVEDHRTIREQGYPFDLASPPPLQLTGDMPMNSL